MGKREQEKWDLPSGQGAVLALLCALFFAGGVAGSFFAAMADGAGGQALSGYLADYLSLARDGAAGRELWASIWYELRYWIGVCLLGLTGLGLVGIPLLFLVRGFFFTFSVGCFCRVFGGAGLVPALVLFGLPALLWGPAFFLAGFQGLTSARCLFRRGMGEGRCPLPFSAAYWLRAVMCGGLTLVCGMAEYWVVPVLLRAAARAVL